LNLARIRVEGTENLVMDIIRPVVMNTVVRCGLSIRHIGMVRRVQRRRQSENSVKKTPPFFIISLDGGGVRGALTLSMLEELEKARPGLVERADLIAGTSTGAIIALLLATGVTPKKCREMYEHMVPPVFGKPRSTYQRFFAAKYQNDILASVLHEYFGGMTLGQLDRRVVIPALRVDGVASSSHSPELWPSLSRSQGWRPAVFTNLPPVEASRPDISLKAVDAALRSSAAPTFFPTYQGYADGGLFANNPSVVALGKTLLHLPYLRRSNIKILSLGTGAWPRRVVQNADMGLAQWSPYLFDLLLDASALSTEISAAYLLKSSYFRLDPSFSSKDTPVAIDDATALNRLVSLGKNVPSITEAIHFYDSQIVQPTTEISDPLEKQVQDHTTLKSHVHTPKTMPVENCYEYGGFFDAPKLHNHELNELVDQAWMDLAHGAQTQLIYKERRRRETAGSSDNTK